MPKFSQQELESVKQLFDGKRGARSISKELGITRHCVLSIYDALGLDNSNIQNPTKPIPKTKTCKICQNQKPICEFRERTKNGRIYYESYCIECESEYNKNKCNNRYQKMGKEEFAKMYSNSQARQEWLDKNKEYRSVNKDKLKEYRQARVDKDRENQRNWQNKKRREDPAHKLRSMISTAVSIAIKKNGCAKNGSILKHLPYSIQELKDHLEKQFEPWMSWNNHGKYESTWTWQLDHIVPQSDLPYQSMTDENFLKCWALENLRPLSAKRNFIDGVTRARHKAA